MSNQGRKGANQVSLEGEEVHWDLRDKSSYGGYLQLDRLLAAQQPRTSEHDEVAFIIAHQASELWLRLALHELGGVIKCVQVGDLRPAFKMLSRVSAIQTQLIEVWSILSTMTPADYAAFRDSLGEASGFQSFQYRIVEFSLGNKNAAMAEVHRHDPVIYQQVQTALCAPSLYDETLRLLRRRDFSIPGHLTERDWSQPYEPDAAVEDAWVEIYKNPAGNWDLYELAEHLMDIEDKFQQWRFRHMKTVSRIIGMKRGTGGTNGVPYLQKALNLRFFPELWSCRTRL